MNDSAFAGAEIEVMETEEQVKKMMSLKNATSSKNKSVTNDKKNGF